MFFLPATALTTTSLSLLLPKRSNLITTVYSTLHIQSILSTLHAQFILRPTAPNITPISDCSPFALLDSILK